MARLRWAPCGSESPARGVALFAMLCTACPGLHLDSGSGTGSDGGCSHCAILDEHNFALDVSLQVAATELEQGGDASLDWTELHNDLLSRPIAACEDLGTATLYLFPEVTREAILEGLANNDLDSRAVSSLWSCSTSTCGCSLSEFAYIGHPLLPEVDFVAGRGEWLLSLSGAGGGALRGLAFVVPREGAGVAVLSVDDQTAQLEATAALSLDARLSVASHGDILLDWSAMEHDGWGRPLELHRLDRAQLDRLDLEPSDPSSWLLALDSLSRQRWTATVTGANSLSLSALAGEQPIPEVDGQSTWLFTLWCSTCLLDLPRVAVLLGPGL